MGAKVFLEPVSESSDSSRPRRGASRRGPAGALDKCSGPRLRQVLVWRLAWIHPPRGLIWIKDPIKESAHPKGG